MKIDKNGIEALIGEAKSAGAPQALSIIENASEKGVSIEEAAILLCSEDSAVLQRLFKKAGEIKEKVFGKRVVLFAPLYLSNYCTNGCVYCGFRAANDKVKRTALEIDEIVSEARTLVGMGFKRVLLVTGEDKRWGLDYIIKAIRAVYDETGMRIVHVNAPPMDADDFRELKASGVGVYQSFQETYHEPSYNEFHPTGRKRDFQYRLDVMDRAIEAGFNDVGIGPLLGLYDHRFDCLAAIAHSHHLYREYGTHAHTISIPRLRPAEGFYDVPHAISDEELKKIVAVFRLAVPSAGVVVSTREAPALRHELINTGATQLSAGSRTNPGGYLSAKDALEQFSTNDKRELSDVIASVAGQGLLPSLCTACYRSGRVGKDFTDMAMAGDMEKFCQANAILTIKEYLLENHLNGQSKAVEEVFLKALEAMEDGALKKSLTDRLKRIEAGEKDLFF